MCNLSNKSYKRITMQDVSQSVILVVDDNIDILFHLRLLLESFFSISPISLTKIGF